MTGTEQPFGIRAGSLFDGESFLTDHCVVVAGREIVQVLPSRQCDDDLDCIDLPNGTLAPGFIDLQVNGGGGAMLCAEPTPDTVQRMLAGHRQRGTTSMLPTLLSDTPERQRLGVAAVGTVLQQGHAGILGIHIEGPFFNPDRHGAHQAGLIRSPTEADIEWLCSLDLPAVLVTLDPGQLAAGTIRKLSAAGVIVCAGHTEASYQVIQAAAAEGLSGVTHLYNAMRQLSAREPGTVGAALNNDALWAGVIADGHHVHPAAIRLASQVKPRGKLVLVSDAMATVGDTGDRFELYGETITEQGGRLINRAGVLAGSAIGLIDAVSFTCRAAGLELSESLRMASLYPAGILGLDQALGRIAPGYRADLVHFDDDFRVHDTWLAGQRASHP